MLVDRRLWSALSAAALSALVASCAKDDNPPFVGSLEWDRVAVTAELAEPVLRWDVAEGDRVEAGAPLLEQDPRRQDARIAAAHGDLMQAEGKLLELTNGARIETIDTARANLARAHAVESDAQMDYDRDVELKKRDLIAGATVDTGARDAEPGQGLDQGAGGAAARAHARHAAGADRPSACRRRGGEGHARAARAHARAAHGTRAARGPRRRAAVSSGRPASGRRARS